MLRQLALIISRHCYLREKPGEEGDRSDSEIVDEIFSGWAVCIFPESAVNGWVRAETHYGYSGYIPQSCVRTISRAELLDRQDRKRFRAVKAGEADLLAEPRVQGLPLELLEKNAFVELLDEDMENTPDAGRRSGEGGEYPEEEQKNRTEKKENLDAEKEDGWKRIRTAAGREGYVHAVYLRERRDSDAYLLLEDEAERKDYFRKFKRIPDAQEEVFREGLVQSARAYLGTQYRWGGKSSQGLDCSGLVFMCYMENGALIYRDAGTPDNYAVRKISAGELKKGDLLFFPGHVAMYLGNGRYIHSTAFAATPCVTINSLNPDDPDYREDLAGKITGYGSIFQNTVTDRNKHELDSCLGQLKARLEKLPGTISFVYRNLSSGTQVSLREHEPQPAASIIKLFLMAAVFQAASDGKFSLGDKITVQKADCVPSCGVLTYLHGERSVSVLDLVELMIIVSDNTAANILFDLVGSGWLLAFIRDNLKTSRTAFRRKMFDDESAAKGIENQVTANDAADLLEQIYRRTLVSRKASEQMYRILTHQRLNGKIPFRLHTLKNAPVIAHKTGEDAGITHDVAIIEGKEPFILCFLGSSTDVPEFERLMADASYEIFRLL